jgi:sugar-specific transcriptional regulator TrmB
LKGCEKLRLINEELTIFVELGVTARQAEVYLAICKLGQASVKTIAKTVQTDRAEIYRVTPMLQKLGLTKKILTTPVSFRAIPPSEAISILLHRNIEKQKELRAKAKQFLKNFKSHDSNCREDFQYTITSGLQGVQREFLRGLKETQTCKDGIFLWNIILLTVESNFEEYAEAIERGVKFRHITHIQPEEQKEIPQKVRCLQKKGSFEIRNAASLPKAGVAIHDKKKVVIVTTSGSSMNELEVLQSNNPSVAELIQEHFEVRWRSASKI